LSDNVRNLPLSSILPSSINPRKEFDEEYINELSSSLDRDGQWNPIIVRTGGNGQYELISGECRLRAAKKLGWTHIKATVLDLNDRDAYILALKTNLVRRNLNVIEEAEAVERLSREFSITQMKMAKLLGKKQPWISRRLSLASQLSQYCKGALEEGRITACHALALTRLPKDDQIEICQHVIDKKLSVRATQTLVKSRMQAAGTKSSPGKVQTKGDHGDALTRVDAGLVARAMKRLVADLGRKMGTTSSCEEIVTDNELVFVVRIRTGQNRSSFIRRDFPLEYFDSFEKAQSYAKREGGYCAGVLSLNGDKFWVMYLNPRNPIRHQPMKTAA